MFISEAAAVRTQNFHTVSIQSLFRSSSESAGLAKETQTCQHKEGHKRGNDKYVPEKNKQSCLNASNHPLTSYIVT
jgi:hypothetical protein